MGRKSTACLCETDQQIRGRPPTIAETLGIGPDPGEDLVQTDRVGVEHRPAAITREAVAIGIDHIDIAAPPSDPFLKDLCTFIDQREHAAIHDLFIIEITKADTLFRAHSSQERRLNIFERLKQYSSEFYEHPW